MRVETIGLATPWVRIYALCEPDWTPRYVGKTTQFLHERHKAHIRTAQRQARLPAHRWLKKRMASGADLAILLLENVPAGADWREREAYWIAKLRADGADLLNLTAGGEGLHGHNFSQEHRAKIAAKLRTGAVCSCETCGAQFWRKRNQIGAGEARFCSRACYAASNKGVSKPMPATATARGLAAAAAKRRALTHCRHGHPLSGDNLFINNRGARVCITCRREGKRRSRAAGRAA